MLIKWLYGLIFIVGMVIGAAVVCGVMQFYWALLGGGLVALSMLIRQFGDAEHL